MADYFSDRENGPRAHTEQEPRSTGAFIQHFRS